MAEGPCRAPTRRGFHPVRVRSFHGRLRTLRVRDHRQRRARGRPAVHRARRPRRSRTKPAARRPAGLRRERGTLVTYLDTLSVNAVRGLCMDAVQRAESGHPGAPTGTAPVAHTLWQRHLWPDPKAPIRPNRDRFATSEGHASTLPWSPLHLAGVRAVDPDHEVLGRFAVTPEDLEAFRQRGSRCPRAPERRWPSEGDHDRAARTGRRHVGRRGPGRPVARRRLQPGRAGGTSPGRAMSRRRRSSPARRSPRSSVPGSGRPPASRAACTYWSAPPPASR